MLTPEDIAAIRERADDYDPTTWNIPATWSKAVRLAEDIPALLAHVEELEKKLYAIEQDARDLEHL